MNSLSVRAKLMLLYLLVTLAGLLIFGLMSYGALQYALLQGKKTHLHGREDRLLSGGIAGGNRCDQRPRL